MIMASMILFFFKILAGHSKSFSFLSCPLVLLVFQSEHLPLLISSLTYFHMHNLHSSSPASSANMMYQSKTTEACILKKNRLGSVAFHTYEYI